MTLVIFLFGSLQVLRRRLRATNSIREYLAAAFQLALVEVFRPRALCLALGIGHPHFERLTMNHTRPLPFHRTRRSGRLWKTHISPFFMDALRCVSTWVLFSMISYIYRALGTDTLQAYRVLYHFRETSSLVRSKIEFGATSSILWHKSIVVSSKHPHQSSPTPHARRSATVS